MPLGVPLARLQDIALHKKVSNIIFFLCLGGVGVMLAVMVFLDLRKKMASGKHATQLGTSKGRR